MAIKKAGVHKPVDDFEETPEVPDAIPRDRWERPLIVPAGGGKAIAYTRASTLGKAIEDTYYLSKWLQRSVAFGLSRRPDLIALVASVKTNEGDDREPLDQLCEKAHEAAKGDKGANVGTALHKLSERRDAGEDLSYLPAILFDALAAYSELMKLFKVLASETFVVCDPLQTAGSFDRAAELLVPLEFHHAVKGRVVIPAGTILIIDLKSGKAESAKYWGPGYGVQQTVYACGDPYLPGTGRRTWEQLLGEGNRPSTEWALLLHVPSDSPQDAGLIIVDLEAGAAMADLCLEIRAARKDKRLMSECYPVEGRIEISDPPDDEGVGELLVQIAQASNEDMLEQLWESNGDIWTDEHTAAGKARIEELAAKPAQVVKLDLVAQLRKAPTREALLALYQDHKEQWDEACSRMATARIGELEAAG
jgi:hypothetical protein